MRQAVQEDRVAIDLNGERGDYFRSFKGLGQRDSLSPLLFNLVTDALSALLTRASRGCLLKGLISELVDGGLTHFQYADDTIIF